MSRLAKKPITILPKTEVSYSGGNITVKGPLGTLVKPVSTDIKIVVENGIVNVMPSENMLNVASLGTCVSHIKNMMEGVNKPFEKKLIIEGIGFKADIKGKDLVLSVGFSHQIVMPIPTDLKVTSEKNTITISGIDGEKVGQFAADIRSKKKPEPYLGKGIRYIDEVIRRKQGKKAA